MQNSDITPKPRSLSQRPTVLNMRTLEPKAPKGLRFWVFGFLALGFLGLGFRVQDLVVECVDWVSEPKQ